ncbi:MAG: hypothetical protein NTV86_16265, partial [Planctomycetota bacterium]|nr:hypothetical protein [Planctomycetota bacterium]
MKQQRNMPARVHPAIAVGWLILAAGVLAPSAGCRKQSPPPASPEQAASAPAPLPETPAPETAPVVTTSPASTPATAPTTAPATAPSNATAPTGPGDLTKLRLAAEARREEARTAQAYRDAIELWDQAEARFAAGDWGNAAGLFDRAAKFSAALALARPHLAAQRFTEASTALSA